MKSKVFHPREFAQLMFDVSKVPDGADILKYFKELNRHKEFKKDPGKGLDNNKVMAWVILVYDKNSPYRKKFNDILKRKVEAANDVEFPTIEGGAFESPVEDFLKGHNEDVNKKIVEYVRLHRSFKYSYLVTIESGYYAMMLNIISGDTKEVKKMKEVQEELEDALLEILNEDNNPYLRDTILRYIEDERLNLRPEDIAQKARDGVKPI